MLVLGEAELRKNENLFLSGGGGGGGGGRCVGARAAFFAVGGILRRGFSLFFSFRATTRANSRENPQFRNLLGPPYMNRALFLCGFFGQSYFDLLL